MMAMMRRGKFDVNTTDQATMGQPYSLALATLTRGGTAPYTFSLVSGTLPAGLTLASTTATRSTTPAASVSSST